MSIVPFRWTVIVQAGEQRLGLGPAGVGRLLGPETGRGVVRRTADHRLTFERAGKQIVRGVIEPLHGQCCEKMLRLRQSGVGCLLEPEDRVARARRNRIAAQISPSDLILRFYPAGAGRLGQDAERFPPMSPRRQLGAALGLGVDRKQRRKP